MTHLPAINQNPRFQLNMILLILPLVIMCILFLCSFDRTFSSSLNLRDKNRYWPKNLNRIGKDRKRHDKHDRLFWQKIKYHV